MGQDCSRQPQRMCEGSAELEFSSEVSLVQQLGADGVLGSSVAGSQHQAWGQPQCGCWL